VLGTSLPGENVVTELSKGKSLAPENGAILSVSPIEDDHLTLERIFKSAQGLAGMELSWQLSRTATLSSALSKLRQIEYPVVICERDLPLGGWKDLLEYSNRVRNPPLVIVTSLHADEYLWAEALNLGAHDVLGKPFNSSEVIRIVSLACLRWYRDRPSRPEQKRKPDSRLKVICASC
jgi:DNA-binding response OmpR family regulator